MKKLLTILCVSFSIVCFSQGKSISLLKKSKDPITLSTDQVIKVGQTINIGMGSNPDGSFKFIQMLNNFNEPIQPADSRVSMMKQPIKFFKEQDGVIFIFTKYFVINIEAAIRNKEVESIN